MTDINIEAKSDRELLILICQRVNKTCQEVEGLRQTVYGNGVGGLVNRVAMIWWVGLGVVSVVLSYAAWVIGPGRFIQ